MLPSTNIYSTIKFDTTKFMQLIEAQGYLFKWERATRCTCITRDVINADSLAFTTVNVVDFDYKCPVCKGRGYNYTAPSNNKVYEEKAVVLSANKIRVKHTPTKIIRIFRKKTGDEYTVSSISGNDITLNENTLSSSFGIYVSYECTLLNSSVEVVKPLVEHNDQIRVAHKYIDNVISIIDTTAQPNVALTHLYFTDTLIKLSDVVDPSHSISVTYQYMEPIRAIMTSLTEQKRYLGIGAVQDGDMQITFSPAFDIGERDRITLLDNEVVTRENELLQRDVVDFLKYDTVVNIIDVSDRYNKYVEGVDYIFDNVRGITWLPDPNVPGTFRGPERQEMYSVTYNARREYIIWREIAQERFHGQVILPRRMAARRIERYNFLQDSSFPLAVEN